MATQQVALKSEEKIQSFLDNAPNYLVRCIIPKENNHPRFREDLVQKHNK